MARGKKSKSKRRRRFTGINVVNVAEGYAQANIWSEALFNTNPVEFLTGFTNTSVGPRYRPGTDGGGTITLPELLGAGPGGVGGNFGAYAADLPGAVARNLTGKASGATAMDAMGAMIEPAIKSALVGVGFKFGKKLTRKPRSMINRQLRNFGLGDMLRV